MRRLVLAAFALALAACEAPPAPPRPVPSYKAPEFQTADYRRIVLVPFDDEAGAREQTDAIARVFGRELEKATSIEVVPLGHAARVELAPRESPRRLGTYRVDAVLDIAARYGADAVLFGTVTAYRPYSPQILGLRAELVSATSGLVVWSVEAQFDLSDPTTLSSLALPPGTSDWDSVRVSPGRLAALVSARAVDTIR
ncbi:MAG TPA: hypothetical protein VKE69_10325 [Planctomycetota bacterium]|nr:hypothetical protein [Planctomycetota bacterium]